jgi:hypothetical protein
MAGTADYQEEVLSNLLDLQAELRGETRDAEEPHSGGEDATASSDVAVPSTPNAAEAVTVATSGLQVTVAPSSAAVADRLAELNQRLSRLEQSLAGVTDRIDGVESRDATPPQESDDADAPWRSFLDLQRIVADRLDRR